MKSIPLHKEGPFATLDVIRDAVGQAPSGINLIQMRARGRVLKAVETHKGEGPLNLEDNDFNTLENVLNAETRWTVADLNLLEVVDNILNAGKVQPGGDSNSGSAALRRQVPGA